jgi:SAM-dependent methyltransferase/glycosyltransferase involved in cell wall biosynthesis
LKKFNEYLNEESNPFRKQKNFNEAVNTAIDDANLSFEEQQKQISRLELEIKALLNQTNSLKTQINKIKNLENQHFAYVCSQSEENSRQFEKCMAEIKPEKRVSVRDKNIIEADVFSDTALAESVKAVKDSGDNEELSAENLAKAEKIFSRNIKSEFDKFHKQYNSRIIAVICTDLTMNCGMEAIRNEAYDIYNALKKKSCYNVKLISIEKSIKDMVCRGDIICVPAGRTRECIKKINPLLCVICESTAHVLTANDCGLLMFRSIVRLSGQNPLRDVTENTMAELCHLNDFGVQKYCVESRTASDTMVKNGFHEPMISYPVIDINKKIYSCRKNYEMHRKFTVGFASSPMTDEQYSHRGMDILCETVKETKGVEYIILWRNKDVEVPEILKNSPHCRIEYGRYDMEKFYSEIDCIMIPYSTENFNHSCSMSAIEAMLNGIPVISTEISGVSEIVKKFGTGLVANRFATNLATSCNQIRSNYSAFSNGRQALKLRNFFMDNNIVKMIEDELSQPYALGTVTLYEWDRLLKKNGKYLVKGQKKMKEYYQNNEIASKYTAHRFEKYPQNCFDMMERKSVSMILSDYFNGKKDLEILDIACGDGRIVQENIHFGSCMAVDSSKAMLELVANRFATSLQPVATSECDFISDEIEGDFDAVTCFRYIRHFDYRTRKILYSKIRTVMTENGIFIFDVPNRNFELRLKNINGWGNYNIYDVFFTRESISEELEKNGFQIRYIVPAGKGLAEKVSADEPMTWTVGAVKKI